MPPRSAVLCGSAGNLVWWSLMPSVAELFAGEVDEDCFQVWFGHSGVRDRETAVVSRRDDLQQDPAPPSHAEVDPAIDDCSRVNSCNAFLEEAGQAVEVSIRADHHDGVGSHRSLQIVWRIQDEDPAVVHDPDAVAQLIRFVHVVGPSRGTPPGAHHCRCRRPDRDPRSGRMTVSERGFEDAITASVVEQGGYRICKWGTKPEWSADFDLVRGLDSAELFGFVEE